jgi:hypothetical protein
VNCWASSGPSASRLSKQPNSRWQPEKSNNKGKSKNFPKNETSQLVTLASLLGHSKIQVVMRYAHPPPQEHQGRSVERQEKFNAARQMEALLPKQGATAGMMQ